MKNGDISEHAAREVMEHLTAKDEKEKHIRPNVAKQVEHRRNKLNVLSDWSLKHTKGCVWQFGGAGVWCAKGKEETLATEEMQIAEHNGGEDGAKLWCPFNSSLNSSTRCELAAAILALI